MNVSTNHSVKCMFALAGLHDVIDPEVGLNVADMGLIYQLNFDEEARQVNCLMTLSTRFCPMGESIVDGVTNNLKINFPDSDVLVELTFDPPWRYEMISEEGRNFLNR
ncbi:metal-sulfur cluster assembly factor [Panacibacter ginsenosidivorans]|uniref:Metal-sulfur cluster assembly factor n=1 Tax=Panacibacter ginsenosidivorans TaxID=1813871 RepID=A0A5B8VFV2_9BACT|nr:metal-sulfur cluster assembly factor [Panacibacter ginsenosidivorans]QEC69208.1 metal-sulfur cluster assembly factor [Panacibacter ginsenosidivorans]